MGALQHVDRVHLDQVQPAQHPAQVAQVGGAAGLGSVKPWAARVIRRACATESDSGTAIGSTLAQGYDKTPGNPRCTAAATYFGAL